MQMGDISSIAAAPVLRCRSVRLSPLPLPVLFGTLGWGLYQVERPLWDSLEVFGATE
jgi:hypothetical protein